MDYSEELANYYEKWYDVDYVRKHVRDYLADGPYKDSVIGAIRIMVLRQKQREAKEKIKLNLPKQETLF
jgi:hypothetical protein